MIPGILSTDRMLTDGATTLTSDITGFIHHGGTTPTIQAGAMILTPMAGAILITDTRTFT